MMARARLDRRGFTMIEIMVVVVLIGIMAAIAVPRFDLTRIQAESAAQTLGTTLLAAQRAAVARQHPVVVAFDVANRRLRIHEDRNRNGMIDAGERVRYQVLDRPMQFGRGTAPAHPIGSATVTFSHVQDGMPAVTFHRNGSASEEGGFYLTARPDRAAHTRFVMVDRGTGRISWFRYLSSSWTQDF